MGSVEFFETFSETFSKFQIQGGFPEEYSSRLTTMAIIFGLLAVACCVIVAIADKKCRAMGIVAAIFNFLSAVLTPAFIKFFHNTPFFKVEYITGSSQAEVDKLVEEFYAEYFAETLPGMILSSIASVMMLLAFVFTLILVIKCIKVFKPKVLAIFALIITILRYLCVGPVDYVKPLLQNGATIEMQMSQATLYFISITLPLILIAIGGIIALAKKGKTPEPTQEPIEVAAEEVAAEEVAAEEVAAEGAVVEETVVEETVVEETVVEDAAAE